MLHTLALCTPPVLPLYTGCRPALLCIARNGNKARSTNACPVRDLGILYVQHNCAVTSNCGNPALRMFGFERNVSASFGIVRVHYRHVVLVILTLSNRTGYVIKDNGIAFCVSSKRRQTSRCVHTLQKYCTTSWNVRAIYQVSACLTTLQRQQSRILRTMTSMGATSAIPSIWRQTHRPGS